MKENIDSKALRAALCDLYKAALREVQGRKIRPMIRRLAVRFLSEDTIAECQDEVALTAEY